jgi:outer membrane protein OmpA-like peptidoglycan-associated protein
MKTTLKQCMPLTLVVAAFGCGTPLAPQELHSARDAVAAAEKSKAPEVAPVRLEEAKQALARAETAFTEREKDEEIATLSYIAQRKAELAVAAANSIVAKQQVDQAEKDKMVLQQQALSSTQQQLSDAQRALEAQQRRAEEDPRRLDEAAKQGKAEVERVRAELEKERLAREAAEKSAASALASLAEIAKVKEEQRGVVITLSGAVLFATGKHELLPIARDKLNDVARALKDQGYKRIVVEGHTDSRGSASQNEALSLRRAQEVRSHLITQGIESGKIEAEGHGSRRAIADNNSPEGRANNRRVEIVVTPQ